MKSTSLGEKIGFLFIVVGFVLVLLDMFWKDSPIGALTDQNLLFTSGGLFLWAFSRMIREGKEKKEKEQNS